MARLLVLVAVIGALGGGWACGRDDPAVGEARLVVHDDSRVVVTTLAGTVDSGETGQVIRGGDRVRVARGGATLEMAHDTELELRRGSEVEMGRRPYLRRGDLLASTDDLPVAIATDHAEAWIEGIARLRRGLAVSAAAYRGTIQLDSAGRGATVRALREVGIPARGLVPGRSLPITYDPADPWDRRFLSKAMELSDLLESRSRGFTAQARSGLPVSVAELVSPIARGASKVVEADQRAAGERIVGAAVASVAGGDFAKRWSKLFSFRDEGAAWGLVVLDQKVSDHDDLVRLIDRMIARAVRAQFASPRLGDDPTSVPPSEGSPGGDSPPPSSTPTTTIPPPTPTTLLPPPPSTGTPLDEPVEDTVDIIAGLLDDTTSTVDDTTSTLDGATETDGLSLP